MSGIPACGYCVQFAFQFSITAYPVFGQEIHGLGGLFQIVQLRPMGEACALLCLDIVLDINEQADLSVLPFRLAGRSGSSGNPGGKGFFGVVNPQRFQTGEPFLIRCSGRDILAALDLITFSLQAAKQFFQVGTGWQKSVNGSFQLCLILQSEQGVLARFRRIFSKNQPYPQLFSEHFAGCLVFLRIFIYNVSC